jgi:hypothetical protein
MCYDDLLIMKLFECKTYLIEYKLLYQINELIFILII